VTVAELGVARQIAVFDSLENGELVVSADSTMRFPLALVTRLEVYAGQQSRRWVGAGIGAAVGGAIAAIIVGPGNTCSSQADVCPETWIAVGISSGALIGGLVGGWWKADNWIKVPLDRLRMSVVPQRGGRFGLGVSIAFSAPRRAVAFHL
jgi:hypothetical protein